MNKEEQNKIDCFKAFCEYQPRNNALSMFLVFWYKLQQEYNIQIPNEYYNFTLDRWLV